MIKAGPVRVERSTMKTARHLIVLTILSAALYVSAAAEVLETYAVINCRIIPVTSPPIEKGALVIRDGLIESIGPIGTIKIPEDAEIIDAQGLTAFPGLISAHTNLFLETRREERPAAGQAAPAGIVAAEKPVRQPGLQAFAQLGPKLSAIQAWHRLGVTTVLVAPGSGIFAGQSVLVNLNGERPEQMVVKNPAALHIQFVTERGSYPSSLMGTMAFLRQSFLDAEHYSSHQAEAARLGKGIRRPEYDPFLEALVPYVVGKKPVIFTCANQEDIKRALRLREEFKLNALLSGANEAWRVSEHLKKAAAPLLVSLDFRPPLSSEVSQKGEEARKAAEKEVYPANPGVLSKAGIRFALTTLGLSDAKAAQKNLHSAVLAGLEPGQALRALTIIPAQHLGVDAILGSLEPGKIANVVVARGNILEQGSEVEEVFCDGILFKVEKAPPEGKPQTQPVLNLAGAWKLVIRSPMGTFEAAMELKQEGSSLDGFISSEMGKWEIRDGVLSGGELSFVAVGTVMNQAMEMSFSGKAEAEVIEGTLSTSRVAMDVRATRLPKTAE
jgi:imidazolonepropionase-like amidohydrolase